MPLRAGGRPQVAAPHQGRRTPERRWRDGGEGLVAFMSFASWRGCATRAQGFDRTEGGGPVGRVDAEEQADGDGHPKARGML